MSTTREALEGSTITEHEQFAHRKLAVADRRLGDIHCEGHHGEPVPCLHAPAQLSLAL